MDSLPHLVGQTRQRHFLGLPHPSSCRVLLQNNLDRWVVRFACLLFLISQQRHQGYELPRAASASWQGLSIQENTSSIVPLWQTSHPPTLHRNIVAQKQLSHTRSWWMRFLLQPEMAEEEHRIFSYCNPGALRRVSVKSWSLAFACCTRTKISLSFSIRLDTMQTWKNWSRTYTDSIPSSQLAYLPRPPVAANTRMKERSEGKEPHGILSEESLPLMRFNMCLFNLHPFWETKPKPRINW